MSITVRVNGEIQTLNQRLKIPDLLAALNIPVNSVVVERNRKILQKDLLEEVVLEDGDELEIIRFVGGG